MKVKQLKIRLVFFFMVIVFLFPLISNADVKFKPVDRFDLSAMLGWNRKDLGFNEHYSIRLEGYLRPGFFPDWLGVVGMFEPSFGKKIQDGVVADDGWSSRWYAGLQVYLGNLWSALEDFEISGGIDGSGYEMNWGENGSLGRDSTWDKNGIGFWLGVTFKPTIRENYISLYYLFKDNTVNATQAIRAEFYWQWFSFDLLKRTIIIGMRPTLQWTSFNNTDHSAPSSITSNGELVKSFGGQINFVFKINFAK